MNIAASLKLTSILIDQPVNNDVRIIREQLHDDLLFGPSRFPSSQRRGRGGQFGGTFRWIFSSFSGLDYWLWRNICPSPLKPRHNDHYHYARQSRHGI